MDTTLIAAVAAGVPSALIGLVSWGMRSWFDEIRGTLKQVNEKVGGHGEKLASLEARMTALEGRSERRRR